MHTRTHTLTHTHTHTHTHTCTHTCTHAHTHARIHTRSHMCSLAYLDSYSHCWSPALPRDFPYPWSLLHWGGVQLAVLRAFRVQQLPLNSESVSCVAYRAHVHMQQRSGVGGGYFMCVYASCRPFTLCFVDGVLLTYSPLSLCHVLILSQPPHF